MPLSKIIFIAFTSSLFFATVARALPIATDPPELESKVSIEATPRVDSLTTIKEPKLLSSQAAVIPNQQEVRVNTSPAGLFRTLLSSLTYEIRFTPLGRLYTAIPLAPNVETPAFFSSRLLPHPEKLQSTALLSHNQLVELQSQVSAPRLQETTRFGPLVWLSVCLVLLGILIYFARRFMRNSLHS